MTSDNEVSSSGRKPVCVSNVDRLSRQRAAASLVSARRLNLGQRIGKSGYERNSTFTMFPVLPFSCLSDAPILSG